MRSLAPVVALLLYTVPAFAQQPNVPADRDRAIATVATPIMFDATTARPPLRVAAIGTSFVVTHDLGEWLEVQYLDPQFGLRIGYVRKANVKIERAASARPVDLSVPLDGVPQTQPAQIPPEAPRAPLPATRSGASSIPQRVFIDADFISFFPQQKAATFTYVQRLFQENATSAVAYGQLPRVQDWLPEPTVRVRLAGIDRGAVGVGFRFLRAKYDQPAGLAVSVPHPTIFNRFGTDADATIVERKDYMLDLNAQYIYSDAHWRYVVQGGPTYFRTSNHMVNGIRYSQVFTPTGLNSVSITSAPTTTITGSTWGVNVGGDVTYFVARHVGVGCGVILNKGTMAITDPFVT
jgi:hypothetical protein